MKSIEELLDKFKLPTEKNFADLLQRIKNPQAVKIKSEFLLERHSAELYNAHGDLFSGTADELNELVFRVGIHELSKFISMWLVKKSIEERLKDEKSE